jgi:hypothetical protein
MVNNTSNAANDGSSPAEEPNDAASASTLAHSAHGRDEVGLTRKDLLDIFDAASYDSGYVLSQEPTSAADDSEVTELS